MGWIGSNRAYCRGTIENGESEENVHLRIQAFLEQ